MPDKAKYQTISSEGMVLFLIFAIYLSVNLLTASLSPTVWMDEVMFSDPAINFHLTGAFTSSAWYAQTQDRFWSGNAPLHSMSLAAWLFIAPLSPAGVRSINFLYMVAAALALWCALRNSSILSTPFGRILFVALVLTGYGIAFSYRSGRYDSLGILLLALIAMIVSSRMNSTRLMTLGITAALLPWAGLQLVILVYVILAIHFLVYRSITAAHVVIATSVGLGAAALIAFFAWKGTLLEFIHSVGQNTSADTGRLSDRVLHRLKELPQLLRQDISSLLLLPVIGVALVANLKWRNGDKQLLVLLSVSIVIIPLILNLVAHFPIYYTWMTFLPLCALVAISAERCLNRKLLLYGIVALSFCAGLVGLPARVLTVAIDAESRNYTAVTAYVSRTLKRDDVAFIDFPAYYPARLISKLVILPPYMDIITPEERAAVTVAILSVAAADAKGEPAAQFLEQSFGEKWVKIGSEFRSTRRDYLKALGLAEPYNLVTFRRLADLEGNLPK